MIARIFAIPLVVLFACTGAHADLNACFENAAHRRNLNVDLLRAIGHVESRYRPWVTNAKSGAIGVMQIMPFHLTWLRKYGIERGDLLDGCTNINVGAFLLADFVRMYGSTWRAVGAYGAGIAPNKERARIEYARLVRASFERITRGGPTPIPTTPDRRSNPPAAPPRPTLVVDK
ncbi:lytic transglycosylase domain-containing protein [Burkholderia sp. LMG 32019]|uniref:lytic transglycosylase domain-containing protein n=1 Tax=Burkholderia sp. LMG 32019 TaxID=3158173 RepID=UPI003C2DA147